MILKNLKEDFILLDKEEIILLVFSVLILLFTLSFIFSYIKVFKNKLHYSQIPIFVISFCYINNLVWYYYSILIFHEYMKLCIQISIGLNIIFIIIYLGFEFIVDKIDSIINFCMLMTSYWAIKKTLIDIFGDEDIAKTSGGYSTIILSCSILELIIRAFKEKNKYILNIFNALSLVCVSVCGIIFGLIYNELSFFIPNIIELILACAYIGIWFYLKQKYNFIKNDKIYDIESKYENQQTNKNTNKIYEEDEKENFKKIK